MNRPIYVHLLGQWLTEVPDVHARLMADPPSRVADIACGAGWSSIAFARAYPRISVDGFDFDEALVEPARRNVVEAGLGDCVWLAEPGLIDAFFYAASLALCLPTAMAEPGAVGTGAVMRRDVLERYAREAGFSAIEVLPIEHPSFRLYRLQP